MSAFRSLARGTAAVALQQVGLAALLSLLLLAWLHVPDANAFEVLLSVLLALLLAGVAGAGESVIVLRLTRQNVNARRLAIGTVAVVAAAVLWYGASIGIDRWSGSDGLHAGYWNSRLPAFLRHSFSYERLVHLLGLFWSALRWLVAALLAAAVFAGVTCESPTRGFRAIVRSGHYWLSFLLVFFVGAVLTGPLLNWTPGHGIRVETLSLMLRLLLVIALNAVAVAVFLQVMAAAVLRPHSDGAGVPVLSQPRTFGKP